MVNYAITVTGETADGSTAFPEPGVTHFTTDKTFQLPGIMAVVPTITADNSAGNGVNGVDVGIFVASPLAVSPLAGALEFVTNSTLNMEFIGGNFSQRAGIDDVTEAFVPATQTLTLAVDPKLAPAIQSNSFTTNGGVISNISEVQQGTINMTFSPDNRTVTGSITLIGGGFIEPGTFGYSATFIGSLIP